MSELIFSILTIIVSTFSPPVSFKHIDTHTALASATFLWVRNAAGFRVISHCIGWPSSVARSLYLWNFWRRLSPLCHSLASLFLLCQCVRPPFSFLIDMFIVERDSFACPCIVWYLLWILPSRLAVQFSKLTHWLNCMNISISPFNWLCLYFYFLGTFSMSIFIFLGTFSMAPYEFTAKKKSPCFCGSIEYCVQNFKNVFLERLLNNLCSMP